MFFFLTQPQRERERESVCVCVCVRESEREREIPVECQVGGDTNITLQPDSGGQGADVCVIY